MQVLPSAEEVSDIAGFRAKGFRLEVLPFCQGAWPSNMTSRHGPLTCTAASQGVAALATISMQLTHAEGLRLCSRCPSSSLLLLRCLLPVTLLVHGCAAAEAAPSCQAGRTLRSWSRSGPTAIWPGTFCAGGMLSCAGGLCNCRRPSSCSQGGKIRQEGEGQGCCKGGKD